MIVLKFGGSSVKDAARIRRAADIVLGRAAQGPVTVVVSALGGVTDALQDLAQKALRTRRVDLDVLAVRHRQVLSDLGLNAGPVNQVLEDLQALLMGIALLGELSQNSLDRVMVMGERMSARMFAAHLVDRGHAAAALDADDLGLRVKGSGLSKMIDEGCYGELAEALSHVQGIPVVTGYIALDEEGNITTLGRSGSDTTASVVGAALGAREVEIWTDVPGVLTADPRLIPHARVNPELSIAEAAELAYFGAKVLHPDSIRPALDRDIPVRVLDSAQPQLAGTIIRRTSSGGPDVCAIASRKGQQAVNIVSARMLDAHGYLARIFTVFDRHHVVVDMVSTSEVSVTVTVSGTVDLAACLAELRAFAHVELLSGHCLVSVVGRGLGMTDRGLAARAFAALAEAGISVVACSKGGQRVNLCFLVADADGDRAVRTLHDCFFGAAS